MRLLALASWWPEPADNGSRLRISNLLRALCAEHEVHLIAFAQGPVESVERQQTDAMCAWVRVIQEQTWVRRRSDPLVSLLSSRPASARATWSDAFAQAVRERAATIRPQLIVAFQLSAAPYALEVAGVPRLFEELELSYLFTQYNAQPPGPRRLRAWLTWAKHWRYVRWLAEQFDACSVVSVPERTLVRRFVPAGMPVAVLPNGVDIEACAGSWGGPRPGQLIYPGSLSFEANFDAMNYFLRAIFPLIRARRSDTTLRITGSADPAHRAALPRMDGVELTGRLPDIRPAVAQAWAEVVPLRKGGGTRLKILEALALGTPVVATPKGAEGLELTPGHDLLIADAPEQFAAATMEILESPALRARLAEAGRRTVHAHHDWRAIGAQLSGLARETATRRPRVAVSRKSSARGRSVL